MCVHRYFKKFFFAWTDEHKIRHVYTFKNWRNYVNTTICYQFVIIFVPFLRANFGQKYKQKRSIFALFRHILGKIQLVPKENLVECVTLHLQLYMSNKADRLVQIVPNSCLRVQAFFHKTVRVCHVYCNFKIGFTCRITVIFGTLKDGSLLINTLASNICFSYRNMFQNGVDALSKIVDAFLSKSSKFHLVRIIR